jgi:hypothetical protein
MSNPVNITYGGYDFRTQCGPIPFPTITKNITRSANGTKIGTKFNMTLEGTLYASQGGYATVDPMQDALLSGFNFDGQNLVITCDAATLLSVYPRINEIRLDKSNDNWVHTTPFTIELEWDGDTITGDIYVDDINETWSMEFNDEVSQYYWNLGGGTGDYNSILVNLSHSISAKGINHYESTGALPAWQHAKNYVKSQLGYDGSVVAQVGVINLNASLFTGYNHIRSVEQDEAGGNYAVNESWILTTGYKAIEDFTASVKYSTEDGITSIDLQGSIQGLESRSYGTSSGEFTITETKWNAASGYWNVIRPRLLGRAQYAAAMISPNSINPLALTYTVGNTPAKGVINYAYTYDTRPCNFITGALSERIVVSDSYPTDVFAVIPIPGRLKGPIMQDMSTVTEHRRNVSIDVVMAPSGGCSNIINSIGLKPTGQVYALLCAIESDLVAMGTQVFKSADSDNWDFKTGRYSRNVEWTFGYCDSYPPSTSFCT